MRCQFRQDKFVKCRRLLYRVNQLTVYQLSVYHLFCHLTYLHSFGKSLMFSSEPIFGSFSSSADRTFCSISPLPGPIGLSPKQNTKQCPCFFKLKKWHCVLQRRRYSLVRFEPSIYRFSFRRGYRKTPTHQQGISESIMLLFLCQCSVHFPVLLTQLFAVSFPCLGLSDFPQNKTHFKARNQVTHACSDPRKVNTGYWRTKAT